MLSNTGRAAIRRVGAGASHQSTNRVIQSLWHLQRVHKSNSAVSSSSLRQFPIALGRSYATTTKATKPKPKTSNKAKAKPTAKKAAPKKQVKKAVKKPKKKVVAKPKPKRRVLTEEQKEKSKLQKQRAELKALKATALTPPKLKPATAWAVLFTESVIRDGKGVSNVSSVTKDASAKYKSFTAEELEVRNARPQHLHCY
jgi:outer membrane biosynthesis protein TonB